MVVIMVVWFGLSRFELYYERYTPRGVRELANIDVSRFVGMLSKLSKFMFRTYTVDLHGYKGMGKYWHSIPA